MRVAHMVVRLIRVLASLTIVASLADGFQDPTELGVVTGRVLSWTADELGEAVVTVSSSTTPSTAKTDRLGSYRISLPAGRYVLRAEAPGFTPATIEAIDVRAGVTVQRNVLLHSIDEGAITGRITDSSGTVLPGVPRVNVSASWRHEGPPVVSGFLSITGGGGSVASLSSNTGTYLLQVRPGTYSLVYRLAGFETQTHENVIVEARARIVRDVVLTAVGPPVGVMPPGFITGLVKNEDGSPARGISVTVDTQSHPDWSWRTWTDESGHYRLQLPPGRYTIWYWNPRSASSFSGLHNVVLPDVVLAAGETVIHDVTVKYTFTCSDCATSPARDVGIRFETTLGSFDVAVDLLAAPITATNFLRYVDAGLYSNGRFHRATREDNYIVNSPNRPLLECIQGGIDPNRRPEGFEPIPLERTEITGQRHVVGTVSMARGAADSATSDFFILLNDQPSLDFGGKRFDDGQGAAAFGRVVKGMDVVRKIQEQPTSGQSLTPPITIVSATRIQP
jgi:peptidyl-prolyl cis-trans isomerase A (cyclophilin A)